MIITLSVHFAGLVLLQLLTSSTASTGTFETWSRDTSNTDVIATSYVLQTVERCSRAMCAGTCERTTGCESFFYNSITRTCQLHNFVFPKYGAFLDSMVSPGSEYFRRLSSFIECHGLHISGLNNEYFIPTIKENEWEGALKICQKNGGELASVPDVQTIQLLQAAINTTLGGSLMSSALWVNARVSHDIDSFVWFNNGNMIPLNSPLWYNNQPDLYNNPGSMTDDTKTECVILVPFFSYLLDDYACKNGNSGAALHPLCMCP